MADENYPKMFTMACAPRNGTVIRVVYQDQLKSVYWIKDSSRKEGGYYYDGRDPFSPKSFTGWTA